MSRDGASLLDGGVEAVLAQVGGAGAALALAEIDGDGDAAVTRGLDGFHLAHAHVDVEPGFLQPQAPAWPAAAAAGASGRRWGISANRAKRALVLSWAGAMTFNALSL